MLRRLRALISGGRLDRELDAELRFHIEMEAGKYVAQGLSPDEARTRAWRHFGPVARHTEDTRDQRGLRGRPAVDRWYLRRCRAQFTEQRRVEFGVRVALGGRASEIVGLVMRQTLPPVAAGIACGLAGAVWLARFVETLLFGTSALDPALSAGASLALATLATMAAAIPARRASRTSPIEAIRGS